MYLTRDCKMNKEDLRFAFELLIGGFVVLFLMISVMME